MNIKNISIYLFFGFSIFMKGQNVADIQKVGYLLNDALFFSEKYIIPATDAFVYQSTASWVTSAKKPKLWETKIAVHGNAFFVPKSNRSFIVNNSDFQFFQIQNATTAEVQTALGNGNQVILLGDFSGQQVKLKTPLGVDSEVITYPYLQASIGLPFGTKLIAKTTYKVPLKRGNFQIYGLGLQQNFSHFFKRLNEKNINFSYFLGYANENVSFDFLDVNTPFGTLGINQITAKVNTYNIQLTASKQFKKFEILGSVIANKSYFNYITAGEKGSIEEIFPAQELVNNLLDKIETPKINYAAEILANYNYNKKVNFTTAITFGKFINTNISVQYNLN